MSGPSWISSFPAAAARWLTRLQAAEAAVAKLEAMLPLEARHQSAQQDLATAQKQAADAKEALQKTHGRWRAALRRGGNAEESFAETASRNGRPANRARCRRTGLKRRGGQRDRRARELAVLSNRIESLLHDADLKPESETASGRLRQLRRELAEEEAKMGRRDAIRKRLVALRGRRFKDRRAVRRLQRARLALMQQRGGRRRSRIRRRANERASADGLLQQRETLHREFLAACTPVVSEAEMVALLSGTKREDLESHHREAAAALATARATLRNLCEQRGHLGHQLKMSTDDRRPAIKQLELNAVEQRLSEAHPAVAHAGRNRLSARIAQRRLRAQSAAGSAAGSLGLSAPSDGRPLYAGLDSWGEDVLRIDDESGGSLGVERLSRGTREQLFLSLRLAIASLYPGAGLRCRWCWTTCW